MANDRVVRAVVLACALLHAAARLADVAAVPSEAAECRNAIQDIYAKFRETSLSKPGSVGLDTETKAKAKYIMKNLCRLVGGCGAADPDIGGGGGGDKKTEKESEKAAVDGCGQQPELLQQRVEAAVSARPAGGDGYDALPPPAASSRQSLSGGDVRPPDNKLSDADATLISSHVRTIESAMDAVQKIILEYVQSNCNMRSDAVTTGRPASVAAAAVAAAGQTTVAARRREDFEDRDADKANMRDVLRRMNLPLDWGGIAPPVSNVAAFASGNGQRGKNDAAAALTPPSLSSSSSSSPPPVPKSSGILFSMFNRRTAAATPSPAKPNDSSTIA